MTHSKKKGSSFKTLIQGNSSSFESDATNYKKTQAQTELTKNEFTGSGFVRLNSFVDVLDLISERLIHVKIVMPDEVDVRERRISVFAPLSRVLLGKREGDTFIWSSGNDEKKFRILKILNW